MNKFYTNVVNFLTPIVKLVYPYRLKKIGELPEGAAIICANHSNNIDGILLAVVFGGTNYIRFMAKKEIFKMPVLGWIAKNVGALSVDRDGSDINALRESIKILKNNGKLMMFPEGTRADDDDAIAAKAGAVKLASKYGAPVLPVYISRNKKLFRKFDVCIGEAYVIPKLPREELEAAADDMMKKIAAMNTEAK